MIAQQIANRFKINDGGNQPKWTVWAIIIKKEDYKSEDFQDDDMIENKAGEFLTVYNLFGKYMCLKLGME